MRTQQLLNHFTLDMMLTIAYVKVDDHLKELAKEGKYSPPNAENLKATPSEIVSIVLVVDVIEQKNTEVWMEIVAQCHRHLFPQLPERSRFQRTILDARELIASFGLSLSPKDGGVYVIDDKPIEIAKGARIG